MLNTAKFILKKCHYKTFFQKFNKVIEKYYSAIQHVAVFLSCDSSEVKLNNNLIKYGVDGWNECEKVLRNGTFTEEELEMNKF